jgi:hypothetical protein
MKKKPIKESDKVQPIYLSRSVWMEAKKEAMKRSQDCARFVSIRSVIEDALTFYLK